MSRVVGVAAFVRRRPGFTIAEVLVLLALFTIVIAIVAPNATRLLNRGGARASAESLENLATSLLAFRENVGNFPLRPIHLSAPITTADRNACGVLYTNGDVQQWRGPYVDRLLTAGGIPLPIGTLKDSIYVAGSTMVMTVLAVANDDALEIDQQVDGGDGAAGGTVRWTGGASVTLRYLVPAAGC